MKSKIMSIVSISTFSFPLLHIAISNKVCRGYKIIKILRITALLLLILVGLAGASPFAYITNYHNNNISVIDTATNTVTATVNVGIWPTEVAVSPDGTKVYVANSGSNNVHVIDTAKNKIIDTAYVRSHPQGIAVSPDGTNVYVTNSASNAISVIDTATNDVTATVNVGNLPARVAVNPDGKKVYVVNFGKSPNYQGTISVIDTATNNVTATINVGNCPQGITVSPNGKKVYVVNSNTYPYYQGSISVIDTTTNNVTDTVNVESCPRGIAIDPNGTRVYVTIDNLSGYSHTGNIDVTSETGAVNVIDAATNEVIDTVNVGSSPFGVTVTPDGNEVYVVNYGSNTVSVIDTATNKVATNKVNTTVPVGRCPIAVGLGPVTKSSSTAESNNTSFLNPVNRAESQTNNTRMNPLLKGELINQWICFVVQVYESVLGSTH